MLEETKIFAKVIEFGSFSKAADALKLPKSSVSRAVSALESQTGTRLLLRTTRQLTLTSAGRAFYETTLGPLQSLDDALKSLNGRESLLQGTVRITGPEDLGRFIISPSLTDLARAYPGLKFDLKYTNDIVDLIAEGFDIAVRLGPLKQNSFKATRIGEVKLIFVASPIYLKQLAKPLKAKSPAEAPDLDYLTYAHSAAKWTLKSETRTINIALASKVTSNELSTLVDMAVGGAGIGLVPSYLCRDFIANGKLVHVFPDWRVSSYQVSLVTPLSSSTSARLKLVSQRLIHDMRAMFASH